MASIFHLYNHPCSLGLVSDVILIHIFNFLIAPSIDFPHTQVEHDSMPMVICHVCRRWRGILLSYSALWSCIYTWSPMAVRAHLSRSGESLLDLGKNERWLNQSHLCRVSSAKCLNLWPSIQLDISDRCHPISRGRNYNR